jgi:signal transduction histidine kinase
LSDLVEDIALILEAEARSLERVPVSLDEVARTAVEDFRLAADQAGLRLRMEIASGLPPVSGSLIYLRRVMDNLLDNAIKFTSAGGVITVRVWQEGE